MNAAEYAKKRTYHFPNAIIHVFPHNGRCFEQPKWCLALMVERSRSWTAEALMELRRFHRTNH